MTFAAMEGANLLREESALVAIVGLDVIWGKIATPDMIGATSKKSGIIAGLTV